MKFRTKHSLYELHPTEQKIRRVSGDNPPLLEQGEDGEWKSYREIVNWGSRLTIVFSDDEVITTGPVMDWDVADSSD